MLLDAGLPHVKLVVGDQEEALAGSFWDRKMPYERTESDVILKTNSGLPSSYSNIQNLPKVRNQDPYGTCWAFAAMGAIEADLIHDGKADKSIDLSELQLAYFTTHDFRHTKGNFKGDSIE